MKSAEAFRGQGCCDHVGRSARIRMGRLAMFLVVVAVTGVTGTLAAGTTSPVGNEDNEGRAGLASRFSTSVPASHSFADIANLPAGAGRRLLPGGVPGPIPEESLFALSRINHPAPARPYVISNLDGAFEDLSGQDSTAPATGANARPGILFPADVIPDPSDSMLLLCGLLVAGFIARRRRGPPAD